MLFLLMPSHYLKKILFYTKESQMKQKLQQNSANAVSSLTSKGVCRAGNHVGNG